MSEREDDLNLSLRIELLMPETIIPVYRVERVSAEAGDGTAVNVCHADDAESVADILADWDDLGVLGVGSEVKLTVELMSVAEYRKLVDAEEAAMYMDADVELLDEEGDDDASEG